MFPSSSVPTIDADFDRHTVRYALALAILAAEKDLRSADAETADAAKRSIWRFTELARRVSSELPEPWFFPLVRGASELIRTRGRLRARLEAWHSTRQNPLPVPAE
jgi:hypothetical protein